jgi:hypothetical protein
MKKLCAGSGDDIFVLMKVKIASAFFRSTNIGV